MEELRHIADVERVRCAVCGSDDDWVDNGDGSSACLNCGRTPA